MKHVVEAVGILKPGARESEIELDRIDVRQLVIDSIEEVLFISFCVYDRELRRVEETTRIQPAHRNEIAPLFPAIPQIQSDSRGTEAAVAGR